jgi:hypothetical protein
MATLDNLSAILKRYMPYELLVEEMKKKNYFWNKVEKQEGWKGGPMEIPFEGGEYSSLSMGSLTASNDIATATEVMGLLSTQPELWGTLKFTEKELDRYDGDMEASYLKLAPNKIEQFTRRMAERVSLMLLGDGSIAKATADGEADGEITVDHPERFTNGEKVVVDDDNSSPVNGYVRSVNINTKKITLYDARTGGSVVDLSGYTTAQNAKIFLPGVQSNGFTSLKSQLLSATNGGASALFGATKTDYQFLQALNHDGSTFDKNNILEGIYGYYFDTMKIGKGNPTEILCSFKHFKNIAKIQETKKEYVASDKKAGYGYRQLSLVGNEGDITITGLRDMSDSEIYIMDWDAMKFHGDKWMERKRHDGREYFLERDATNGYQYIVDCKFYGDLVVHNPSYCGVIHGITNYSET